MPKQGLPRHSKGKVPRDCRLGLFRGGRRRTVSGRKRPAWDTEGHFFDKRDTGSGAGSPSRGLFARPFGDSARMRRPSREAFPPSSSGRGSSPGQGSPPAHTRALCEPRSYPFGVERGAQRPVRGAPFVEKVPFEKASKRRLVRTLGGFKNRIAEIGPLFFSVSLEGLVENMSDGPFGSWVRIGPPERIRNGPSQSVEMFDRPQGALEWVPHRPVERTAFEAGLRTISDR